MKTQWKAGDEASNTCPRCHKMVRSRFELRTVQLARSRLSIPDVLVDVCPECDHMISFAAESLSQLLEASAAK